MIFGNLYIRKHIRPNNRSGEGILFFESDRFCTPFKEENAHLMQKVKKRFLFALTFGLIFFMCGPACGQGKLIDRDHLLAQAEEKGNIRVIVAFNVPDLEKRQQTSRLVKVLRSGVRGSSSEFARAEKADGALGRGDPKLGPKCFHEPGIGKEDGPCI